MCDSNRCFSTFFKVSAPPAECKVGGASGYKLLAGSDRAEGHILSGATKCDRSLTTGWYRLDGSAGGDLPTSPPPTSRCQTHAPGWFQGVLPNGLYQKKAGKVCFHWSGNNCRWSTNILVTNCGAFRVYRLVPTPACSLRYCGNKKQGEPP